MTDNQAIFEQLFNRKFTDAGNMDLLNGITARHPYFSPAQFFLLQNTAAGSNAFEKQAVKTNILFNNPHWLNFQLQQTLTAATAETAIAPAAMNTIIHEPEPAMGLPDDTDATGENDMEAEIEPMKIELKIPGEKSIPSEAMLFEPMHMVDYFASQGIKLTDEVQMSDKLGKQLKSFTEWLKTMKKVHVESGDEMAAATTDSIQTLAEISNTEAEVLTESMAEVFTKQGKTGKAVEVYQKLSLLNPSKSAYFAAKIENLKGI